MDLFLIIGITLTVSSILVMRGRFRADMFVLGVTLMGLYIGEYYMHPAPLSPEYAVPLYKIGMGIQIGFPITLAVIYLFFVLHNHGVLRRRIPREWKKVKIW